jgi:mannose-6-phosphate isomerase-like protein (cupin superfamily)
MIGNPPAMVRGVLLVSLVSSFGRAQDTAHFVMAGRVSVRHLSAIPWDSVPGIRGKIVIGTVGSLSLIELSPGAASAAPDHYHTREQINVGLTGIPEVQVDSQRIPLPRGTSIVVPSNVVHVARNTSVSPITYFEFHIVRRPDLVSPFVPVAFPRAPTPARLDPGAKITLRHDFESASPTSAEGKSSAFTVHVLAAGSTMDIPENGDEHFWYSLGAGSLVARNDAKQGFDENSIVVIPPSWGAIRVIAINKLTLLDFAVHPTKP